MLVTWDFYVLLFARLLGDVGVKSWRSCDLSSWHKFSWLSSVFSKFWHNSQISSFYYQLPTWHFDFNSSKLKLHIGRKDISFSNSKIQIITRFDSYYFGSLLQWCFNPMRGVYKTYESVWTGKSSANNWLMIIVQFLNSFHVWKWHVMT